MIAATQKKEVILDVAGEGGGYTILGEQHHGRWRFWRDPGSGDAWMFDDDNQVNVESARTKPTPEPAIDYCDTLDEVLKKINVNWPRLYPLQVHPSFASDILQRVTLYLTHTSVGSASGVTSRWQERCLVLDWGKLSA